MMALLYPNDLARLTLAEMAQAVLAWLRAHPDIGANKHGRLSNVCRIVEETRGIIEKEDDFPRWRALVQAFKDVQEYWYIIEVLGDHLLRAPLLDPFIRSLDDPLLPADSAQETRGRDAQFELFLAAAAARAGLDVDQVGASGADWEMSTPTQRWSLEAKRVKSWRQVEKRIRKAAKQIAEREVGGVVALDISAAANPSYDPLPRFVPDEELHEAQTKRGEALLREALGPIKEWTETASVGFLLLYDFVIRPGGRSGDDERPWSFIGFWDKMDLIPIDSPYRDRYDELWLLLATALPDL